jgi:hypothetical protein
VGVPRDDDGDELPPQLPKLVENVMVERTSLIDDFITPHKIPPLHYTEHH